MAMSDIGFFFSFEGETIQLPINPEQVEVSYDGNNKLSEIVKIGEVNLLRTRKLATLKFECFFPYEEWFPGIRTLGRFRRPSFYRSFFVRIMEASKPCRLVITGLDINMLVSIEQFPFRHQAGDHEDMYYTLSLKEYRNQTITQIALDTSLARPTKPNPTTGGTLKPEKITVGSEVILNGVVHYTSYGEKPGQTFRNYRGRIDRTNFQGTHPYHVTTPAGGWLGWVVEGSLTLV